MSEELRCRRCGVPVEAQGHAVYFAERGELGWLPLCAAHLEEAWTLVCLYVGGNIDVLPHNALALHLAP